MDRPAEPVAAPQKNLTEALDRLWARFLPEIRERVAVLESAASSAAQGALTDAEREAAHAAAHKLAGVLGTFGLTRGTELARELEIAFSGDACLNLGAAKNLIQAVAELRAVIESRQDGPSLIPGP